MKKTTPLKEKHDQKAIDPLKTNEWIRGILDDPKKRNRLVNDIFKKPDQQGK